MDEKGIHVLLSEKWSEKHISHGKQTRYRIWNKKNKLFCLKLTYEKDEYRVEVSKSLENVDMGMGVIFDIPDFPFDKQYTIKYRGDEIELNHKNKYVKGNEAVQEIKKLFSYESIDYLTKDIFKGV